MTDAAGIPGDPHPERVPVPEARFLAVDSFRYRNLGDALTRARYLLSTMLDHPSPRTIEFVLEVGGPEPPLAGFVVRSYDSDSVEVEARQWQQTVPAAWPDLKLAEPVEWNVPTPPGDDVDLVEAPGPAADVIYRQSPALAVAAGSHRRMRLTVRLGGRAERDGGTAQRCRISLRGTGPDVAYVASQLAADVHGAVRLVARPRRSGSSLAPEVELPLATIAQFLCLPLRLPGRFPSAGRPRRGRLTSMVDEAVPPHVAIFGRSGQGKTTLMEEMVAEALARGDQVLVMCPRGDLAARVAYLGHDWGDPHRPRDLEAVDFGSSECPAHWNPCMPPQEYTPRGWAVELVRQLVRSVTTSSHPRHDDPWMWPLEMAFEVLIRLESDPQPITWLYSLLDPDGQEFWWPRLEVLDDRWLTARWEAAIRFITECPSGMGPFTVNGLGRTISEPGVNRILDTVGADFDLDGPAEGRSLVVAVPEETLGPEGASLLSSLLLSRLWWSLRHRERERGSRPVQIFVDEAQLLGPGLVRHILTEGRRAGVRLTLSVPSPSRLDDGLLADLSENCGLIGTFRTGRYDAELLEEWFTTLTAADLTSLENHVVAMGSGHREALFSTSTPRHGDDRGRALAFLHRTRRGARPEWEPRELFTPEEWMQWEDEPYVPPPFSPSEPAF